MVVEQLISNGQLVSFVVALFAKVGLNETDARIMADSYVDNNLRGIDTHGVRLIPNCLERLKKGGINPRPDITVEAEAPSMLRLNGDNGPGQLVGREGMNRCIARARASGIGLVVCANTNNAGAMGSYTRIALEQGMAGLAMATTIPSMFAWGGLKRIISNPPLSICFPGRKVPFLMDFCLGSVAWNKIYTQRDKGLPIPEGWAVDAEGKPTRDPIKAAAGGSVLPIGGHKGYALSLAIELFTAILGGHHFGDMIKGLFDDPKEGEGITMTLLAVDVEQLIESNILYERIEEFFDSIKSSPRQSGVSEILIPGEPEDRVYRNRLREGIPLPAEVRRELQVCASQYGIPFPSPAMPD
jgi:LDH2 family malate/lactate/ureidoglycolate dehydrogenase